MPRKPKTAKSAAPSKQGFEKEVVGGTEVYTSVSTKIKTLEDLLNYAEVNRELYEVERFIVNSWEVGAKDDAGELVTKPLFQIKAWLRPRRQLVNLRKAIGDLLEELEERGPRRAFKQPTKSDDGLLLEMAIPDLHIGKLVWAPECGQNYDSDIAARVYKDALNTLVSRALNGSDVISEILFPVGSDLYNVDNAARTTTAGTPQDEDGRFQRSFALGRKLMVETIEQLSDIAPVRVVVVPGNHDFERVFYLGDVLEAWFRNNKNVRVDNLPALRKYHRFGKCLIGLTHGDKEKHKDLPLIMATEVPDDWAKTRFREFHLGHFHHRKEIHFQPVSEQNSIRVRFLPSLSPPDAWHTSKGYNGLRAAEAFLWHPEQGNVGQFSYYPTNEQ